jgi:hypothetical protein
MKVFLLISMTTIAFTANGMYTGDGGEAGTQMQDTSSAEVHIEVASRDSDSTTHGSGPLPEDDSRDKTFEDSLRTMMPSLIPMFVNQFRIHHEVEAHQLTEARITVLRKYKPWGAALHIYRNTTNLREALGTSNKEMLSRLPVEQRNALLATGDDEDLDDPDLATHLVAQDLVTLYSVDKKG